MLKALLLSVALAQEPTDKPIIYKLDDGTFLYSREAHKAIDDELKRLQALEKQHKEESWLTAIAVSASVGVAIGLVVGLLIPRPPK